MRLTAVRLARCQNNEIMIFIRCQIMALVGGTPRCFLFTLLDTLLKAFLHWHVCRYSTFSIHSSSITSLIFHDMGDHPSHHLDDGYD